MTNFVKVIQACENASGAGTKKTIQAALVTADKIAQRLIAEALNPYRVFGIRKYESPQKCAKTDSDVTPFFMLLDSLAARKLTGNAAATAVTAMLAHFTRETASYLERIFDKDLKAGFSADTVNKIFKGLIPTFEVMLANKCETPEEFEAHITFPCQADYKYDGERTIAIVKKDSIVYYSRSGKEATHVNGLFDEELAILHDAYGQDFVLDGERYASNFTETMNAKKEGNDLAKANLRFRAFFLMPLSDWVAQKTKITMKQTRACLQDLLCANKCKKIVLSEGREVKNYHDMMNFCNEAIDKHGVEGLILKEWKATYAWDRTLAWCKVKRFYDVDCRIVDLYSGRPKSRLENTLGGIEVIGFLESGERVAARVGSGFSDELRKEIWNNSKKWLGRTVVIKYQEISRAKNKEIASLRFPTYERDRDDKIVEI